MQPYFRDIIASETTPEIAARELTPPADDEVEITVMGYGTGESIVVHVGESNWLIVDCFRIGVPGSNKIAFDPAPIQYLKELGVDPALSVRGVLITHPHHDHFDGIDDVMKACEPSRLHAPNDADPLEGPLLYFSQALSPASWKRYFAKLPTSELEPRKSGQLSTVVADAEEARRFRPVSMNHQLEGELSDILVFAPTPQTVIGQMAEVTRIANNPNFASVVLWIEIDDVKAMLCADLDKHHDYGWHGVLNTIGRQRGRLRRQRFLGAQFVKAPHHGSSGAHHDAMYERFCRPDAHVAVTRNLNSRGGLGPLPDDEVVTWLTQSGRSTYTIGTPTPISLAPSRQTRIGWVRARKRIGDNDRWVLLERGHVA